jgi:hypothetical protein
MCSRQSVYRREIAAWISEGPVPLLNRTKVGWIFILDVGHLSLILGSGQVIEDLDQMAQIGCG